MGRVIAQLDQINSTSQDGINELYQVFYSIPDYQIPIVRYSLYPGSGLLRQRINNEGEVFSNVSDLYYPPASVTPLERANLPCSPMFYACTFPPEITNESPLPIALTLEETSSFMKDTSKSGIERATVSRWDVVEQVNLIALPFIGTYKRPCPELTRIKKGWDDTISKGRVPQDALDLVTFMAREISRSFYDKSQYFKIANFVHYLLRLNLKTKNADGIIYPSVPAQGAGFNVAIKPEITDRKIRFVSASECHLLKKGMKMAVIPMNDSVVDEYGNLSFIEKVFSPQDKAFYEERSEGLCFVN